MASVLLKLCTACKEYTLQETCPRCGAKAKPNRPAKFSPEDQYGEYRRKLKKLDAAKAATSRPATEATGPRKPGNAGSVDPGARPGPKPKGA